MGRMMESNWFKGVLTRKGKMRTFSRQRHIPTLPVYTGKCIDSGKFVDKSVEISSELYRRVPGIEREPMQSKPVNM